MRCTVTWTPDALNQLADIWRSSQDRTGVTRASHNVDAILRDQADVAGSLANGYATLRVPPLDVVYCVRPDDRIVRVLSVLPVA